MHNDYYHTLSYESFTFSAFISLVIMFHRLPDDSYRYICKFHKGTGTHYLCYNTPPHSTKLSPVVIITNQIQLPAIKILHIHKQIMIIQH